VRQLVIEMLNTVWLVKRCIAIPVRAIILRSLRNLSLFSVLDQINPEYTLTLYTCKVNFILISSVRPRLPHGHFIADVPVTLCVLSGLFYAC